MVRCHLLKCLSHFSCIMCACVRSVSLSPCQNVIVIMWNNVSLPLPLPSALPLLSYPLSYNLAVCGTQWIPTLHCSCAVRPNQRLDLYWFSATCARRLAAAGTPRSLPPLLSFPAPSPPPSPGATDAQCAVQSICHQLSAFSRAMKCGKMGERGRRG